jgi:hypothetical protein
VVQCQLTRGRSRPAAAGKQPVWCAEDHDLASMAMAARLGFEPVDRIVDPHVSSPLSSMRFV